MRLIEKTMRSRVGLFAVVALSAAGLTWVAADAQSGPDAAAGAPDDSVGVSATAVVEQLHAGLVDAARDGGSFAARYQSLLPLVRDTHDLVFIASMTIRRQWRDLDADKKAAFVAAFEPLSVATYASRFANGTADTFRLDGAGEVSDGRVEVDAAIVRAGEPDIPLQYVLQLGDGMRIVNILADGVSDLALKRAEYQRVFRDGGSIDDLIGQLADEADRQSE